MNVVTFKEGLTRALEKVPEDAELVLGPGIIIPLTRNGVEVGKIKILETESTVVFHTKS